MNDEKNSIFVDQENNYNKVTQAATTPDPMIGIDLNNDVLETAIEVGASGIDLAKLQSLTQTSQNRNELYNLIDMMCQDSTIASILDTYVEDATETNDEGKIVWAESSNSDCSTYVNYLLDTLNIDKHIFSWVLCLCKYGDVYLRLFRESDYDDVLSRDLSNKRTAEDGGRQPLQEDINIRAYSPHDKFVHYLEMVANPAEMFELLKYSKTYAYIKADTTNTTNLQDNPFTAQYNYSFNKKDVTIHGPMDFVHGSLTNDVVRYPEEITIFTDNTNNFDATADEKERLIRSSTFKVNRGQSMFQNMFKTWRELNLLENSMLLNRLTKSSITRILQIEVAQMPKEKVADQLRKIKSMIEQKSAITTGSSYSEYTNPGPQENIIYVPTRGGVGAITSTDIGGEVNVGSLADVEHFQNKLFGSARVPKQYFGLTDDAAGFSGGESLALISARYGKLVKRVQAATCQMVTDAVNILLMDKNMTQYINEFRIRMQAPTTKEESDRRENLSSRISVVRDILDVISGVVDNPTINLKITKALLSNTLSNQEVIELLEDQVKKLEAEGTSAATSDETEDYNLGGSSDLGVSDNDLDIALGLADNELPETMEETEVPEEETEPLPSPEDLGVDFTQNEEV